MHVQCPELAISMMSIKITKQSQSTKSLCFGPNSFSHALNHTPRKNGYMLSRSITKSHLGHIWPLKTITKYIYLFEHGTRKHKGVHIEKQALEFIKAMSTMIDISYFENCCLALPSWLIYQFSTIPQMACIHAGVGNVLHMDRMVVKHKLR